MYLAWNYCDSDESFPVPPLISAQAYRNFGQHFGQHWWMFVQYHAETIAKYGFAEGLNIGTLPASGTNYRAHGAVITTDGHVSFVISCAYQE